MKKTLTPREAERKAKNKKLYKIAAILFAFAAVLFIIVSAATSGDGEDDNVTVPMVTANREAGEEMDEIHRQARNDAQNGISADERNEAIEFIVDNYNNYFKDDQTMKQAAYYGSLLDGAYQNSDEMKTYSEVGLDVYQVARDVYREADTPNSEFIKSNLEQIKEGLEELGYAVK